MKNIEGTALPRIFVLAWLYIAHTHSSVAVFSLSKFIEGFQTSETLKIGELWAMPSVLRYVLIENLRRISDGLQRSRDMRDRADQMANQLAQLDADDPKMQRMLARYSDATDDNDFAAQLLYRLRDSSIGAGHVIEWLERRLEARNSDAEQVLVYEQNRLSSGNVTIGNIVRSLRLIDDVDWTLWVEDISEVDKILRDHSDFGELDFRTRDSYRDRIEVLARRSKGSETDVAFMAVTMAAKSGEHNDIGFYLSGSQNCKLEKQLGYRQTWRQRAFAAYSAFRWFGVLLPMAIGTLAAVLAGMFILSSAPISTALFVLLLVLASFPAMEAANGMFHWFASILVTPTRFPGYEWEGGIPVQARTLVAVPCMLTSRDAIDE